MGASETFGEEGSSSSNLEPHNILKEIKMSKTKTSDASFHLSHIELAGYKTINDISVGLSEGLSIIIGKNGVGKTNFINFLTKFLNGKYRGLGKISAKVDFQGSDRKVEFSVKTLRQKSLFEDDEAEVVEYVTDLNIDGEKLKVKILSPQVRRLDVRLKFHFLKHGIIHEPHELLNEAGEVGIATSDESNAIPLTSFRLGSDLYFVERILSKLENLGNNYSGISSDNKLVAVIKKDILEKDLGIGLLAEKLREYSPIKDIRINPNFNIYVNRNTEVASVKNLLLDFKINGSWIPFSDLSDGTKRIFIIISELSWRWAGGILRHQNKYKPVKLQLFFIEEPELGIHPHQLYDLMRFIKEESRDKQIIITTHSPDVLDILDKDSLDRIILADYDIDKGTQLRHLTNEEKRKATTFLENEAFLSDYWKHSTLEAR